MRRQLRIVGGILLSILLVWFLFRGTDWRALGETFRRMDFVWLLMAFLCTFASLFARVQRWSYVVRATQPAAFRSLFSATQIGMLVNSLVPARIGDLVRGYVFATLEKASFARSLTLVALDRINDVLALVIVLLVALLSFPTRADVEFAAGTFGNAEALTISYSLIRPVAITLSIALAILILLLVFLYFRQDGVLRLLKKVFEPVSPKFTTWLGDTFLNFASGMHIFKSGGQMTLAVLWSLATWGLIAVSLVMLLKAFHLELPWSGAFTLLAVLGVFTSVTVTPGMVGQFHVPMAAALFLVFPGMDSNEAKAIAIVAHLVALVPPVVLGTYSMMGEQLKFRDLVPERTRKTPGQGRFPPIGRG